MKIPDLKPLLDAYKIYQEEAQAVDYYVRSIFKRYRKSSNIGRGSYFQYFPDQWEWKIEGPYIMAEWRDRDGDYGWDEMLISYLEQGQIELYEDECQRDYERRQQQKKNFEQQQERKEYLRLKQKFES